MFILYFYFILFFCFNGISEGNDYSDQGLTLFDAVKEAFYNQPNILIQKELVEANKAQIQSAKGQFDHNVSASFGLNHDESMVPTSTYNGLEYQKKDTESTSYALNFNKQYRSGIRMTPTLKVTRTDAFPRIYDSSTNSNGSVTLEINVPLRRGWGEQNVAANETASKIEYEASLFDLNHKISQYAMQTIQNYWEYVGAKKRLDQLKMSEQRASRMVKEMSALIQADERPKSDIEQVFANLANKTASRLNGENLFFQAKQNLAISMGIPFDKIDGLPMPKDEFIQINDKDVTKITDQRNQIISESINQRSDYIASQKRKDEANIVMKAAKNNELSKLDFNLNLGYSGRDDYNNEFINFSPLSKNVAGLNASFYIRWELPIENNSASGLLYQKLAQYRQALISTDNTARTISSNVDLAIFSLKNIIMQLYKIEEAINSYKRAVENESKKFKIGTSTILDLISTEDRLSEVLLNEISGRVNYSNAVAKLRFETGTLLTLKGKEVIIEKDKLMTLPIKESIQTR
ncbi:MAG: TolC family protein [Desulfobacterales bacterium]|nr:TolC family protein [Desulfobacterales bacterium]MBF0396922.1 TolC family protein [Desulfobacterales bacterium]